LCVLLIRGRWMDETRECTRATGTSVLSTLAFWEVSAEGCRRVVFLSRVMAVSML
jgi:hypothetical protein